MSDNNQSNKNSRLKKIFVNIAVIITILICLACLISAFIIGKNILGKYFTFDKVEMQTLQQTVKQSQKTERTFPQKSEDGQILNIYGEPLTEPKPKYVPIEETETEENTGKSSKKDKAIYLEAIDNSNVHTEAGQEYPAVDVTEIGEKCRYLGVNEYGWLLIKTEDGNEGYVYQTHFADIEKVIH